MSKCAPILLVLTSFILFWSGGCVNSVANSAPRNTNALNTNQLTESPIRKQQSASLIIKNAEAKIPQVLFWVKRWRRYMTSCPDNVPDQIPIFSNPLYSKFENKRVKMLWKITDNLLRVDLVELKTQLSFLIVEGSTLSPPTVYFFCNSPLEQEGGYQMSEYTVPKIRDSYKPDSDPQWDKLLAKIVKEIEHWVDVYCGNPEMPDSGLRSSEQPTVRITIPKFAVGDPDIYILVKGKKTESFDNDTIMLFRFLPDDSDPKDIRVVFGKSFSRRDETKTLVSIIRKNALKEIIRPCADRKS